MTLVAGVSASRSRIATLTVTRTLQSHARSSRQKFRGSLLLQRVLWRCGSVHVTVYVIVHVTVHVRAVHVTVHVTVHARVVHVRVVHVGP